MRFSNFLIAAQPSAVKFFPIALRLRSCTFTASAAVIAACTVHIFMLDIFILLVSPREVTHLCMGTTTFEISVNVSAKQGQR